MECGTMLKLDWSFMYVHELLLIVYVFCSDTHARYSGEMISSVF